MPNDSRLTQVLSHKALSHLHTYNGREHTQQFKDYQNQYQMSLAQYRWKITVLYSVPSCGGLHGYPGEWKAEWRKASPMFSSPLWSPDLSLHWASQLRIWQTDILKCCTTRTSPTILCHVTLEFLFELESIFQEIIQSWFEYLNMKVLMTELDAKCFDFIKMFIISCTTDQQKLITSNSSSSPSQHFLG